MKNKFVPAILTLALLANTFLVSQTVYAKAKTSKDMPGSAIFVMAVPREINVDTKKIEHSSEEVDINIKYPELHGLSDHKFEKIINNYFKANSQKAKKEILKEAKNINKEMKDTKETSIHYELIQNFVVKDTINGYFVIELFEYSYKGGAHGETTQKYLVIDLGENKIIMLKDLFEKSGDYISEINLAIKKEMNKRREQGEYFFEGSNEFKTVTEDTQFYIDKNGELVIVFNLYEIAPYASGIIKFNIIPSSLSTYKITN